MQVSHKLSPEYISRCLGFRRQRLVGPQPPEFRACLSIALKVLNLTYRSGHWQLGTPFPACAPSTFRRGIFETFHCVEQCTLTAIGHSKPSRPVQIWQPISSRRRNWSTAQSIHAVEPSAFHRPGAHSSQKIARSVLEKLRPDGTRMPTVAAVTTQCYEDWCLLPDSYVELLDGWMAPVDEDDSNRHRWAMRFARAGGGRTGADVGEASDGGSGGSSSSSMVLPAAAASELLCRNYSVAWLALAALGVKMHNQRRQQ